MSFLKGLFGRTELDGEKLARSPELVDYGPIDLLAQFAAPRAVAEPAEQQRWSRALPKPYGETIKLLEKQGWLAADAAGKLYVTEKAQPILRAYDERLAAEKTAALAKVHQALVTRDTGEALNIRRAYEARFPLGQASWTGPEPQLSHSALTRRILFLDHWLLEGLSKPAADWIKLYAAEQQLWGASWRVPAAEIPAVVQTELAHPELDATEAAFCKASQLTLYVENHETWQRCKGGDHVRRIALAGPDDADTCAHCRATLGKEFLVARVPELPHRGCTSLRGCRCRYEPVLESYEAPGP